MNVDLQTITFFGIVAGAILRTLIPYLYKINEVNFLSRYGISMLISIIFSFMLAQQTFLTLNIPMEFGTTIMVLAWSMVQGFGINAMANEFVVDHLPEPASAKKAVTTAT
jgi:hypothetical protein